ncbi:LacI family transcriptional regulator [Tessaracoccus rhinocerotis]|uniref:LacI family transcriptional regulator n=1 Tax=Tessaracoccus rhinocerotis TaxID=1689449 RepID=A0A553K1Q1_9ACTN|nr:LacI family DNA-binding transcriptional regulator [Tessaracoccus rhinocerotis]TRY18619.1 LacI family transcriptional regulator [Tessaracoccus rhinocerotis]
MTRRVVATNAEVARQAGVSPATVSRIMNGRFTGAQEVAERVRQVAADLGYSPNHLARSLALGQTGSVAFLVPDLGNPAFQQVLAGLSKAAAADGHRVLIADSAESSEDEPLLAVDTRRRCDALVLCAPRMTEERLAAVLKEVQPVVLVNRTSPGVPVPSISIDYAKGILNIAEHLHRLGHRRFAYLAGVEGSMSNQRRLQGLATFEARHPDATVTRLVGGVTAQSGSEAADAVLEADVTAALAFNDLVAVGLVQRVRELGLRVPDDLSVTGFDDIPFAAYNTPSLTTASVPYELVGEEAWRRLYAVMNGEPPAPDVLHQPRLQVRDSTRAIR